MIVAMCLLALSVSTVVVDGKPLCQLEPYVRAPEYRALSCGEYHRVVREMHDARVTTDPDLADAIIRCYAFDFCGAVPNFRKPKA